MSISDRLYQYERIADEAATMPQLLGVARTDIPELTAALRAVLDVHTESRLGPDLPHPYCGECGQMLPCATRRAVHAALGEEA